MRILLVGPLLFLLAAAASAGPGEGELPRAEKARGAFNVSWSVMGGGGARHA